MNPPDGTPHFTIPAGAPEPEPQPAGLITSGRAPTQETGFVSAFVPPPTATPAEIETLVSSTWLNTTPFTVER